MAKEKKEGAAEKRQNGQKKKRRQSVAARREMERAEKADAKVSSVVRAKEPRRDGNGSVAPRAYRLFKLTGRFYSGLALLLLFVLAVLLTAPNLLHHPPGYDVGDRPNEDLVASVTFQIPDREALQEAIERARRVEKSFYYRLERDVADRIARDIEALSDRAREILAEEAEAERSALARRLADWAARTQKVVLRPAMAEAVLEAEEETKLADLMEAAAGQIYGQVALVDDLPRYEGAYRRNRVLGLGDEQLPLEPETVVDFSTRRDFIESQYAPGGLLDSAVPYAQRELVAELLTIYGRPNLVYLSQRSEAEVSRQVARLRRNPPMDTVRKGSLIAGEGRALEREQVEMLGAMHATISQTLNKKLLAITMYIGLLFLLVFYYLRQFRQDIEYSARNAWLVGLIVLLPLAMGRVLFEVVGRAYPDLGPYTFPAGLVGMLAVILLDARTAVLLVTVGALAFSVTTGLDFKVLLSSLMGGWVAVSLLTAMQERREVIRAGILVGLMNFGVILLIHYIDDPKSLSWEQAVMGFCNGIICGMAAMPLLVVFEAPLFGVVTDVRLLELTGLDHPLLKQLEEKAPGSYQHSLNVMKLSEVAAKAIGANYLLVRAGAAFHDIGKMLKPKYFGENQVSVDEKGLHSRISPFMSVMVIKNHVKGGIDLARQYKLPERIVDFIPQHQGTATITFFYHQALKRFENSQSTDPVDEEDFRYPGPKPQNIETAIVMLADTVDATVTSRFSARSVNEDELRLCVKRTITDKFNDGQFDDCDLTLRDLHEIRESFVRTLLARFHHRVRYPSRQEVTAIASATTERREKMERGEKLERKEKLAAGSLADTATK